MSVRSGSLHGLVFLKSATACTSITSASSGSRVNTKKQTERTSRRHRIILYLNLNHSVHDDTVSIKQTPHTKPMIYNNEIPDVDSNNNKMD